MILPDPKGINFFLYEKKNKSLRESRISLCNHALISINRAAVTLGIWRDWRKKGVFISPPRGGGKGGA